MLSPCSWPLEESQVESCEHQDNANVHCQALPESISEEPEINTDDDGCHRQEVKRAGDVLAHFSLHGLFFTGKDKFPQNCTRLGSVSRSPIHQDDPYAGLRERPESGGSTSDFAERWPGTLRVVVPSPFSRAWLGLGRQLRRRQAFNMRGDFGHAGNGFRQDFCRIPLVSDSVQRRPRHPNWQWRIRPRR